MSLTICLLANTLYYPEGGGHLWVYLNRALALRALGCQVIWMEAVDTATEADEVRRLVAALKVRLDRYGIQRLALCSYGGDPLPQAAADGLGDGDAAEESDLLLNFAYEVSASVIAGFRRSALVDIDPGLLQVWMSKGWLTVPPHSIYFSTGETVGRPGAKFPDAGLQWHYAPHCVALDWWPVRGREEGAAFTTVSNWNTADEWMEDDEGVYSNDKRDGFLPFLKLPQYTDQPLELALCLSPDDEEELLLRDHGWRVQNAEAVTGTPWDYQAYVQASKGEFSCVKPSCIRLANAWISDRTLCYMASGKPAVIEHTGPSRLLPNAEGLFRFRTQEEAVHCLEAAASDYERHSQLARALVEEHFDARKVMASMLERALA